jgi:8-oxo-dGTP diphosphatase
MKTTVEQATLVAIAVVQQNEQFLVGIRPAGKPLAGFAEFPGGKVDAGETPEQAAVRECFEESGLVVEVAEKYFSTVHRYSHGLLEIHFFHCRPVVLNQSENNSLPLPKPPFRWVSAAELATLEFPAANHELTQFLLR